MSRPLLTAFAAAVLFAAPLAAQTARPVVYEASFDNAVHREARIAVTFRDVGDAPLELRMARSSPGRYAIHEFAKNVYDVAAVDGAGRPLAVARRDPYSWIVAGHDGTVTATYTLYADRADGTYSQVDQTHAHLNIPATFMWAKGFEARPVEVSFRPPQRGWTAATQMPAGRGRLAFTAPDLQYFMDSPVLLGDLSVREWRIGDGASRQTVRLAVRHEGEEADIDALADKTRKIVDAQIAVFGAAPKFDYGVYTFIANYTPQASGDGMEHRNSTILTSAAGLYESDFAQIGTLSHEFIHAWNVERLRPAELEPFDFTRANPTPSLWFAEGFTSYYGPLTIARAGVWTLDEYLAAITGQIDAVLAAPGRRFGSPMEMSLRAPFVDAATSIDPVNTVNTFVSYYSYGAVIALALDLTLRQRFDGVTLDDYMRRLWRTHGETEEPYTHDDLREALAAITGDSAFAETFFAQSIEGSALPDLSPLLAQAGLALRAKNPGKASLGRVALRIDGRSVFLDANTRIGSPLYAAGLDRGDEIVRIGRFEIASEQDYARALARAKPGETTVIRFVSRGQPREARVAFEEDDAREVIAIEKTGEPPSAAQRAFRAAWLGAED